MSAGLPSEMRLVDANMDKMLGCGCISCCTLISLGLWLVSTFTATGVFPNKPLNRMEDLRVANGLGETVRVWASW